MDNVYELFAKISLDSKDFEKGLKNAGEQLKKIPDTISKAGSTISNFGKGISSVGSKLTNSITKPALAAGTAVAGIFVAKGWSRLTQIDNAKAKLRGLGHDAESVKNIMDSALASVKGTAFGMDEAATTAASAVAAGIKQGEDLTRYLKSVGDAAAIANVPMADMGAIFNKVATSGKAQGEVLRQLADRGIPIYQWLAEEAGVSGEQVSEMAKKGSIDLEMFRKAIEKNVGGAALQLGNATLTGALANVGAAISRVGANFLGAADDADSFAGKLLPVIIKAQEKLGVLEDKAKEWGKVFGEIFGAVVQYCTEGNVQISSLSDTAQSVWGVIGPILDKAKSGIEAISSLSPELISALAGIALGAGPVLKYGGEIINIIGLIVSNGGMLIAGISALTATLAYLTATGKDTTGVFQFISDGIAKLGEVVPGIAENIMAGIPTIIEALSQIIPEAMNVGTEIITTISNTLIEGLPGIIESSGEMVKAIGEGLIQNLPLIVESAVQLITTLTSGLSEALPELIPVAMEVVLSLASALIENAPALVEAAIQLIMAIQQGCIEATPLFIQAAPQLIAGLVGALLSAIPQLIGVGVQMWTSIIKVFIQYGGQLVATVGQKMGELIQTFIMWAAKLPERAAYYAGAMVAKFISFIVTLPSKLQKIWNDVLSAVKSFGQKFITEGPRIAKEFAEKLVAGFKGIGNNLLSVGSDIVAGLKEGIKKSWTGLTDWIKELAASLIKGFKDNLKIGSPSKVFADEIGKWIPAGIAVGIEDNVEPLYKTIDNLTKDIIPTGIPIKTNPVDFSSALERMAASNQNITVQVVLEGDADRLFRVMQSKANNNYRLTGNAGMVTV